MAHKKLLILAAAATTIGVGAAASTFVGSAGAASPFALVTLRTADGTAVG
ncbi:MAG: hypothetical protein JWL70_2830, partial [Acidimicrobiia bacterium]|nr:hypothetical protein [Acidimicrobiia bacterium]